MRVFLYLCSYVLLLFWFAERKSLNKLSDVFVCVCMFVLKIRLAPTLLMQMHENGLLAKSKKKIIKIQGALYNAYSFTQPKRISSRNGSFSIKGEKSVCVCACRINGSSWSAHRVQAIICMEYFVKSTQHTRLKTHSSTAKGKKAPQTQKNLYHHYDTLNYI